MTEKSEILELLDAAAKVMKRAENSRISSAIPNLGKTVQGAREAELEGDTAARVELATAATTEAYRLAEVFLDAGYKNVAERMTELGEIMAQLCEAPPSSAEGPTSPAGHAV